MDQNLNLITSLVENDSIKLNVEAKSWEEAVEKSLIPLVISKAIEKKYIQAVIDLTKQYGPYYIISDKIAMPHARPENGVNKSAFGLIILQEPIFFDHDQRSIKILISLAAASADIHVGIALPQVVAAFEDEEVVAKIINANSKEAIIATLKKVNYNKYLEKEQHV